MEEERMKFFVKRYRYALAQRKNWLWLVVFGGVLYAAGAALIPDRFLVTQKVYVPANAPIADVTNPMSTTTIREIVDRPADFFQDPFALSDLAGMLVEGIPKLDARFSGPMKPILERNMTMAYPGDNIAVISYLGPDRLLGETLVACYAHRLVKRAQDGAVRSQTRTFTNASPASSLNVPGNPVVHLVDGMQISNLRSLWRLERLAPLLLTLVCTLILVLIGIGVAEWSDASFKSERQVARYLDADILGSLPDVSRLTKMFDTPPPDKTSAG